MVCKTCGDPIDKNLTSSQIYFFISKDYCTKECQLAGECLKLLVTGLLVILLPIGLTIWSNLNLYSSVFGLLIFLLGWKIFVDGNRGVRFWMASRQPASKLYPTEVATPKRTVQVPTLYSPELEKDVPACCYQTARLGDSYCTCGRAIPEVTN